MSKPKRIGGLIPALLVLFILIAASAFKRQNLSLAEEAERIVEACAGEKLKPGCYDQEVPKLMDYRSMEDAFEVTRIIQEREGGYLYCHPLGHKLGARETKKNPDRWKDVVAKCPTSPCDNGCLHGVFQERFGGKTFSAEEIENLKLDLATLCEEGGAWSPTGRQRAACYNGLGRLVMFLTQDNIDRAVELCDEVAKKPGAHDHTQLCFDGAFTRMLDPSAAENLYLARDKKILKENLYSFCREFGGKKSDSCWLAGWSLYREELEEPEEITAYCANVSPEGKGRCYTYLTNSAVTRLGLDLEKLFDFCSGFENKVLRGACFADSALRMIQIDRRNIQKSVEFCSLASEFGQSGQCFDKILERSTNEYHPGSESFLELCNSLPDPWRSNCLKIKL